MATVDKGVDLSAFDAYRARMFGLLGDRDPLDVLTETPSILAGILKPHSAETLRTRPYAGKWTPNEILGHVTDTEWTCGFRLRMILCQDRPAILGFNQELWVTGQRHNDREPAELVEMFTALRRFNLVLWRRLTPADLERVGIHNERGPESLGTILRMFAGHDLSHIDQISRYLAAIQADRR